MLGVCSNSVKTKVLGAEVDLSIRSTAARAEVADLESRTKGSRAFRAFCCDWSMLFFSGKGFDRLGQVGGGAGVIVFSSRFFTSRGDEYKCCLTGAHADR